MVYSYLAWGGLFNNLSLTHHAKGLNCSFSWILIDLSLHQGVLMYPLYLGTAPTTLTCSLLLPHIQFFPLFCFQISTVGS